MARSTFQHLTVLSNIGSDLNVRKVGDSTKVEFSLPLTEAYNEKERTTWLDCEAWGGLGEVIAKYFVKGDEILVSGTLSSWRTKEDKQRLIFKVRDFQFTRGKKNRNDTAVASKKKEVVFAATASTDEDEDFGF